MKLLGRSGIAVSPLCFGGNVFGWTVDERDSHRLLDAYVAGGGNFIDTADMYADWMPGSDGGESEQMIGNWLAACGRRDDIVLATKAGQGKRHAGLSATSIRGAIHDSLRRLQTDYVDLYFAHIDDEATPLEETLGTFDDLIREGKVRCIGASNYTAARVREALDISDREHLARFSAVQPHYNLMERSEYEGELASLCHNEGLACVPYAALADGFLTGKYRPGHHVSSERAEDALRYMTDRGLRVLSELDLIAASHRVAPAAVAISWLLAQTAVVAAIASARTVSQLQELLHAADLRLSEDELRRLSVAASPDVQVDAGASGSVASTSVPGDS